MKEIRVGDGTCHKTYESPTWYRSIKLKNNQIRFRQLFPRGAQQSIPLSEVSKKLNTNALQKLQDKGDGS